MLVVSSHSLISSTLGEKSLRENLPTLMYEKLITAFYLIDANVSRPDMGLQHGG